MICEERHEAAKALITEGFNKYKHNKKFMVEITTTNWDIPMLLGDTPFSFSSKYTKSYEYLSFRKGAIVQISFAKIHLNKFIDFKLFKSKGFDHERSQFNAHCRCVMAYLFLLNRKGLADIVYKYMEGLNGS